MAVPTTCPKCSAPLLDRAKFCAKCGAVIEDGSLKTLMEFSAPPSVRALVDDKTRPDVPALDLVKATVPTPEPAPAPKNIKQTMLGFAAVDAMPPTAPRPAAAPPAPGPVPPPPVAPPPVAPPSQNEPPTVATRAPALKTMLGVAAPDLRGAAPPPAQAEPARPVVGKTMLGVAIPGIAPTAPGQPAQRPAASGTMLGVAIPGIAPLHAGGARPNAPVPQAPSQPRQRVPIPTIGPIVPAPAPLVDDEPVLAPPTRMSRAGVPVSVAAAILAGVMLVAGIVIAIMWKGTPPIVARPALDPQGKEALHLVCDTCADGTHVELAGAKVDLKEHQGDLVLTAPLVIGDNPFALSVKKPGASRDEAVKIVVPVSFRIRADMNGVGARPAIITVRVEAVSETQVEVDGKPVTLDAQGHGSYAIDVSADTEGPSVETRRVEKKIPYVVTHKTGEPSKGTLTAAVGIVPLQIDAPSSHAVTEQKTVLVAGQTTGGASVTVNGEASPPDQTGAFSRSLAVPASGELAVDVVATAPQQASRIVHLAVRHVESLDAEARAAETLPALSYDQAKDDIGSHVGKAIVVEGEIIETRYAGHQTILVLTDRRGCAGKADPNNCLARILFGGEDKRKKGEHVRVFGRITRPVPAQNGKSVPEIEADFLAKPRGG